jgi:hypothetical protein
MPLHRPGDSTSPKKVEKIDSTRSDSVCQSRQKPVCTNEQQQTQYQTLTRSLPHKHPFTDEHSDLRVLLTLRARMNCKHPPVFNHASLITRQALINIQGLINVTGFISLQMCTNIEMLKFYWPREPSNSHQNSYLH